MHDIVYGGARYGLRGGWWTTAIKKGVRVIVCAGGVVDHAIKGGMRDIVSAAIKGGRSISSAQGQHTGIGLAPVAVGRSGCFISRLVFRFPA